jgi:hypothetical protein
MIVSLAQTSPAPSRNILPVQTSFYHAAGRRHHTSETSLEAMKSANEDGSSGLKQESPHSVRKGPEANAPSVAFLGQNTGSCF